MANFLTFAEKLSIAVIQSILINKLNIPRKKTGLKFGFFSDLGFDEWSSFKLIENLEVEFGINIPWDHNFNGETIKDCVNLVCKKFS